MVYEGSNPSQSLQYAVPIPTLNKEVAMLREREKLVSHDDLHEFIFEFEGTTHGFQSAQAATYYIVSLQAQLNRIQQEILEMMEE